MVFSHLLLQFHQQQQDVLLNHDVQRGGGLVGENQLCWKKVAMAIITRWRMPPES